MPAPDVRAMANDAVGRARRAIDNVADRLRDARVLAVVIALCVCAMTNPSAETFHAACVKGKFVKRSALDALMMRTQGRVCSNYGLSHALRLRKPTYGVHDVIIASIARTRGDSRHFLGVFGTWTRVPKVLNFIPTVFVNVYRVHATVFALIALGALGALAVRALRLIKTVVVGVCRTRRGFVRGAASVRRSAVVDRALRRDVGVRVQEGIFGWRRQDAQGAQAPAQAPPRARAAASLNPGARDLFKTGHPVPPFRRPRGASLGARASACAFRRVSINNTQYF